MPDNQNNSIGISGQSYKDFLLTKNIQDKLDPKYGKQLAMDIEAKYSAGVANGYSFLRNDRFKTNILWSAGKINAYALFADLLNFNGKINYANIDWKPLMIINRIISGLVGRWMQRIEKVHVTAIDPISVNDKKEQYEQAEFVLYNRKQLEQLQQESGVPMIPPDQFVAEDKDDLEEWAITGQKLPEEIKYETGTNDILQSQGFFDVLKKKLLHDSAECGLVGTYVWMDEYGVIHVEWVKPLNTFYSYSEYDDFRDTAMRGYVKSMKISELRRKYGKEFGGKLTEEEIFQIAQTSYEYQRFDKLTWNYDWLLAYIRPYDEWNVECLVFWIKSVDEDGYLMTVTKQNKRTIIERRQQAPTNLDENQEFVKKDKWNLYKGVYVRYAQKMLEWGLDNNMIRPQDPKECGDVEFPISLYMYQNQDMRNIALPEKIEVPVKQMMVIYFKMQQVIATMIPPGAAINIDALQEVQLGLAADGESSINVQKLYEQTGRLYYRGRDAEGNALPVPITELQNAGFIGAMNGLIDQYQFQYGVLKDQLGEDPNLITQAVQPRVTSENVEASQQAAAFATDYMYDAYSAVMAETAKKVACLLNNSVRFGSKAYHHLMQEEDVADRQFATRFEMLPDQYELMDLKNFMNQSLAANPPLIQYLDPFRIMRIAKENVKLASLYLRNAMKRMNRAESEKAQQLSQQNAQVQAMAAQQKAQGDMQLQTQKLQVEKELEEYKGLQAMKLAIVQGAMQIAAKSENPQMPTWLAPVLNQLVPNLTIPIDQENQQMAQLIQGQAMQQQQKQQESQEPASEEMQESPEMVQQEQIQ
jgi:hypothetical protein